MPHEGGPPLVFNRAGILKARQTGHLTEEQASTLLNALIGLEPGAELTQEEANQVVSGGQVDRGGTFQNPFRGIGSTDERDKGLFTRSSFGIPLPGTDAEIGVNAPLGLLGLTALTLGATAPAGGIGAAGIGGSRAIIPGLNALRGTTAAARFGGLTGATVHTLAIPSTVAIGGGIIGSANQPAPDFTLADLTQEEAAGGAELGADIADRPGPTLPTGGGDPQGPIERNPVIDSTTGQPVQGQFFYTQDGIFVDPGDIQLTPNQERANVAFQNTREGQEFLNQEREEAAATKFQNDQILAGFNRQRDESIRQGDFEEARNVAIREEAFRQGVNQRQRAFLASESRAQRDASFVNALLPILASPGSRFRFAANVSRLGGGQAAFTPTEAFGRLFRFSGLQPGQQVPLTGEQNFSIIPNIQQFADQGPRALEELEAIIGESTGRELSTVQRQSKRLAPPR